MAGRILEPMSVTESDYRFMRRALQLAGRARGLTSPNPMVGAVIAKRGRVLGEGYHHRAGEPHAEVMAIRDAARKGNPIAGASLYVTLEPCCTFGRTPPCVDAILREGIAKVFVAAVDPNPSHSGRGLGLLKRAGVDVVDGVLVEESARMNEAFNHWIVHRTPWVVVKSAMTLDGKIATRTGESKWITGEASRAQGMRLRGASDAILVGVNTVLADNPSLTYRSAARRSAKRLRRIVLDSRGRTPLTAQVLNDAQARDTVMVVTRAASARRVAQFAKKATVWTSPSREGRVSLPWLLKKLGREGVVQLLVEGGGEVAASFLLGRHAHRVAFFYAPMVFGGRQARRAVGGDGATDLASTLALRDVETRRCGQDLYLTATIQPHSAEFVASGDVRRGSASA